MQYVVYFVYYKNVGLLDNVMYAGILPNANVIHVTYIHLIGLKSC